MKRLVSVMLFVLVATFPFSAAAQIPNAGFENWTNGNPDGWNADNVPGLSTPVTKSASAHTGTGALQGQVVTFVGFAYGPLVTTIFGVSQRHANLTGFYKFTSVGGDSMFVSVFMYNNLSLVGAGGLHGFGNAATYTQFSVPIDYLPGIPDTCIVEITIVPQDSNDSLHVGSTFVVDDLAFSGINGVEPQANVPLEFGLSQNYPNPFNPTTNISYSVARETRVTIGLYNILGQQVAALVDEVENPGTYSVKVDGSRLPSGMYFYKMHAGDFVQTRRMVLVK